MISRITCLLFATACLCSCSDERLSQTFELGDGETVIRVYRDASGFATTTTLVRLELYSSEGTHYQQVLHGTEPHKLDVRLDETNNVLLIYFCAGVIDKAKSVIKINGQYTVVQPIISDFKSDASNSSGCEGMSFSRVNR